ncbi:MAG: hypothetical protein HQL66_06460 [Magnetococcales bacterium]|nr:hypothetical protein [Magnetococcales bacterium]
MDRKSGGVRARFGARVRDPFRGSLMAQGVGARLFGAGVLLLALWSGIVWAVALP